MMELNLIIKVQQWNMKGSWQTTPSIISGLMANPVIRINQQFPGRTCAQDLVEEEPMDKLVNDRDSFVLPKKFYAAPNGVWGG